MTLADMDVEADRIISNSIVDSSVGMDVYTRDLGIQLNGVYETSLGLDLLTEYGIEAARWCLDHPAETIGGLLWVGGKLKKVYHDYVSGESVPTPQEFRILLEGGVYAITGANARLTVTRADGSIDSR